ncbi:glycosyl transferase family, a/b domain-containing protein [Mortierella sp. GBAus27b]|nr:glycosyl transferase family, a/b domain-containing protein [Mortierella sp. GBAus27b]
MGHADHFQIGFYLTTIRINGIDKNPQIVAACAKAMTKHAISVSLDGLRRKDTPVVDIVGTGGDGHDTFNVSTTAAIVAAGAGCIVAKHGNRSSSSACGSADILEMYGCKLNKVRADNVKTSLDNPGFCFLFAQEFHPAMKNASVPRKQIGIPTIFNLMGPLINPAAPKHTLIGVSSHEVGVVVSGALKEMGVEYGMVVCGANGLDEISPEGSSHIWVVKKGEDKVVELDITPKDFGLEEHPLEDVKGGNPQQNKAMLVDLFDSDKYRDRLHELYRSKGLAAKAAYERKHRAIKDFVLLNTAALIVVADGKAPTGANLKAAVTRARKSIEHKWALKVADDFEGSTSGTELIGFSLAVLAAAALRMAVVAFK